MLAATDGHAKNSSLRILAGGRYQLTPLYDDLSLWQVIGDGASQIAWHNAHLAMAVRFQHKHYHLKDNQRRHFNATAAQCGLGESAEPLIEEILTATPGVVARLQQTLPGDFPHQVLDAVLGGLEVSAKRLANMPAGFPNPNA